MGKLIWHGNPDLESYKEPFKALLNYGLKTARVDYFYSDTTHQGVISPDARNWFQTDMTPRALKGGVKRVASVSSANVFKRYYINLIISSVINLGVPMKVFGDRESAERWLVIPEKASG